MKQSKRHRKHSFSPTQGAAPSWLLVLLLGAFHLLAGCPSNMSIGGVSDTSGSGSSPDDDDTDDDTQDDDDNLSAELADITGYFRLVSISQQPNGSFVRGGGQFLRESDSTHSPEEGPQDADEEIGARGQQQFGCNLVLPDDDFARGSETDSVDAGAWAKVTADSANDDDWAFTWTRQVAWDSTWYDAAEESLTLPVEPGTLLDFEVEGGQDVGPFALPDSFPTFEHFSVKAPSLASGAGHLQGDPEVGLNFLWEPANSPGIELGIGFSEGEAYWLLTCWVEDDGAFDVGTDWLSSLPKNYMGAVWFRRSTQGWHPAEEDRPNLLLEGSRELRWWVELIEPEDAEEGADTDSQQGDPQDREQPDS